MLQSVRCPWALVATLVVATGCTKSPVERHVDTSIGHLQAAHDMLRRNAPSLVKLSVEVVQYRSKHKGQFTKLRVEGERMLKAMTPGERKTLSDAARKRALPIVQGIEAAAALYPNQRMAMRLVRPLVVAGTPKGLPRGQQPPWLPEMPKVDPKSLPPGIAGPSARPGVPPAHLRAKPGAAAATPAAPAAPGKGAQPAPGAAGHAGHGHAPGEHGAGHGHDHGGLPPSALLKPAAKPATAAPPKGAAPSPEPAR